MITGWYPALCLTHRYIIMIVIKAVRTAVTGTVMTNVITAATDEDKPTKVEKLPKLVSESHIDVLQNNVDIASPNTQCT